MRTPGIGGDGWRQVHFMVFDLPGDREPFEQRVLHMRALIPAAKVPWLARRYSGGGRTLPP